MGRFMNENSDMSNICVKEVTSPQEMNDFISLPRRLYAGSPYYVPDMDMDIRETFDARKNPCLDFSDIQAFVAYDAEGHPVGRIAGIINHRANEKWHTQNVRFGFIEFVDDPEVSSTLLQAVEQWGRSRGMRRIQGPMGIFDFDKEGMLVEDFDRIGSMVTIYNPSYYPRHLERLGYTKEVDWVQILVRVPDGVPEKFARIAGRVKEMFGLSVKKVTRKELMNGYGRKIFDLLNVAYAGLFGYTELTERQIDAFVQRYAPLMDMEMLTSVENAEGDLIGVAITMYSLSHALQKSQGKFFPLGWYHLLRSLKWKHENKVEMLLIAVRPDYQGKGVNAVFFDDLIPVYNRKGLQWAETGPQLEDNHRELAQWRALDPTFTKRRRCYRKELEEG